MALSVWGPACTEICAETVVGVLLTNVAIDAVIAETHEICVNIMGSECFHTFYLAMIRM